MSVIISVIQQQYMNNPEPDAVSDAINAMFGKIQHQFIYNIVSQDDMNRLRMSNTFYAIRLNVYGNNYFVVPTFIETTGNNEKQVFNVPFELEPNSIDYVLVNSIIADLDKYLKLFNVGSGKIYTGICLCSSNGVKFLKPFSCFVEHKPINLKAFESLIDKITFKYIREQFVIDLDDISDSDDDEDMTFIDYLEFIKNEIGLDILKTNISFDDDE